MITLANPLPNGDFMTKTTNKGRVAKHRAVQYSKNYKYVGVWVPSEDTITLKLFAKQLRDRRMK